MRGASSEARHGAAEGGREARGRADPPALVAELQRLLLVLFHLGPQPPHRVLELRVLLPEAASLAGTLLADARRGARWARTASILGRRWPGERSAGGAKADQARRAADVLRRRGGPALPAASSLGGSGEPLRLATNARETNI